MHECNFLPHAPFAMRNTVVYNYDTSLTFYASSYYSTYNGTIFCLNGSDCTMNCSGSNCNHLNMICDATSTCSQPGKQYMPHLHDLPIYYRDKIALILRQLGDDSSKLHKNTLYRIKLLLGIDRLRIGNEFEIVYQNTIDTEYKNGVLLRLSIWRGVVASTVTPMMPEFMRSNTSQQLMNVKLPTKPQTRGLPTSTSGCHDDGKKDRSVSETARGEEIETEKSASGEPSQTSIVRIVYL